MGEGRGVVVQLPAQPAVHHIAGEVADEQGVAIRRRLGRQRGAQAGAAAGAVFHHEGLAEAAAELLGEQPGRGVRGATGGVGHDDPHRPVRVGLRPGAGGGQAERQGQPQHQPGPQRQPGTDDEMAHGWLPPAGFFAPRLAGPVAEAQARC
jgi:hypothetical protein